MMRQLHVFIALILFVISAKSQNSNNVIYSIIINDEKLNWAKDEPLIVVNKLERKIDFSLVEEFTKPKKDIPDDVVLFLNRMVDSDSIQQKVLENSDLKNAISGLINNFTNHPKLDCKNLQSKKVLECISRRKYFTYFGKKKYRKSGWEELKKDYNSNWVIEFSKINYNGKFACVYYANHCGGLCGIGKLILLEMDKTEWKIIGSLELWVS